MVYAQDYNMETSYTITYDEKVKGFTSFHSFKPDWMLSLNNSFFTIKNGQLYRHNEENAPRNNFYGDQFTSKVSTVINQEPSDDKIFKTLVLEGNKSWDAKVATNFSESTITKEEFNQRESRWFGYIRKNTLETDTTGAIQGIGNIQSFNGNTITFTAVSDNINIGHSLYMISNDNPVLLGVIEDIEDNTITLSIVENTIIPNNFAYVQKDKRIEGSEVRGYYMAIDLENDDTDQAELFAVNSNIIKSYV